MALTAVKGFNDILPEESGRWQYIEQTARRVFELNGFGEIRVPVMEKTELFCRSIGDATDIVEKDQNLTFTNFLIYLKFELWVTFFDYLFLKKKLKKMNGFLNT